jgi:hypothetical protein
MAVSSVHNNVHHIDLGPAPVCLCQKLETVDANHSSRPSAMLLIHRLKIIC